MKLISPVLIAPSLSNNPQARIFRTGKELSHITKVLAMAMDIPEDHPDATPAFNPSPGIPVFSPRYYPAVNTYAFYAGILQSITRDRTDPLKYTGFLVHYETLITAANMINAANLLIAPDPDNVAEYTRLLDTIVTLEAFNDHQ